MHKGRLTVAVLAGLGVITVLFPWAEVQKKGMEMGFAYDFGIDNVYGFQTWMGYTAIILFVLIAAFALIGKKDKMIAKGFPKMAILIFSGLVFLEGLLILLAFLFMPLMDAKIGVYLIMLVSLLTAVAPYFFKADGTVAVPEVEDVMDDIEDSAEIVEDRVEEIADQVEDKIEDVFDKDDNEKQEENGDGLEKDEAKSDS